MAQVFASDNTAITGAFIVPSYADKTSHVPDVAMAPDGTFRIIWIGPDLDYSEGVQCRSYDASGNPIYNPVSGDNGQFRVNALADTHYYTPAIGMRSDNSFVVTWEEYFNGTGYQGIYAQRFNAAGAKIGITNFEVWGTGLGGIDRHTPDIDVADSGNFVIVYRMWGGGGSSDYDIGGQRYDSSGTKSGTEFRVNTTVINTQEKPRVSVAANGLFVVVWQSYAIDGSGWGIYGQRYNAVGAALGGEFLVNTKTAAWQWNPDVACDRDGNFTVVWQSYDQPDDPITADYGIVAKSYNSAGVATTGDYVVNNPGLAHRGIGDQEYPAITRKSGSGQWVSAWQGYQGIAPSGGILGIWRSQVSGSPSPTTSWVLNAPLSGNYLQGSNVTVSWFAVGVQPGFTVCLCITTDPAWGGTPIWISIGIIAATNGWSNWVWDGRDTSGNLVPKGTYYIAGYIWNGSAATYAHASTTFIIS
jgi:hypothetical protein